MAEWWELVHWEIHKQNKNKMFQLIYNIIKEIKHFHQSVL